jgi:nucleoside-diphosphate-sugar epimerase
MATAYAALEGARRCDVPLFIYASSFSVLGYPFAPVLPTPVFLPIDETHPVGPQDIYATTKWLGEELVESFVRQNAFRAVSLRMPWVQTPESFAREVGPRRRTRDAAADLWAYIDARDAGFGFVQALGWRGPGHLRCFLSAADTYSEQPTRELVSEFYGNGPKLRRPLDGHASLIDTALAKEELRFVARHTWRDYPLSGA